MVSPKTVWIAVVASAAGILFAAWLLGGWGGASTIRAVDDIGLLIFALFAATCAGLAARLRAIVNALPGSASRPGYLTAATASLPMNGSPMTGACRPPPTTHHPPRWRDARGALSRELARTSARQCRR